MSQSVRPPETLEITKVRPFGTELRAAIRAGFGTNRQFGIAISVTEGRVSQILSGVEVVSQHSLDLILTAFSDFMVKERLHQAWVSTFVASPLEKLGDQDVEIRCDQLLENLDLLIASGKAKQCTTLLASLRKEALNAERRFRVSHALINLNLYLGRPTSAISLSKELAEEAHRLGESTWIAAGLFSLANASRSTPNMESKRVIQVHEELGQFVSDWKPSTLSGQIYRTELQGASVRDRALTLLSLSSRRVVNDDVLKDAEQRLTRFVREEEGLSCKVHALEVQARLLLALGNVFGSEEVLEEVRSIRSQISVDHEAKAGIVHGQIMLARGKQDEALQLFDDLLAKCLETDAIHQAGKIDRILSQLSV